MTRTDNEADHEGADEIAYRLHSERRGVGRSQLVWGIRKLGRIPLCTGRVRVTREAETTAAR